MDVTIFGIDLTLNPVAFTLPINGGWSVYWYGIIIATGFMLAIIYGMLNAKRMGVNSDRLLDVVIVATPVAILGARLYYIVFDPTLTLADFFDFSGGGFSGLAIYGGVIGAFVSGALMCYLRKVNILNAFDLAAVGFLIGQGIGRWGNFINQEAFGTATGSSWFGMTSENVSMVLGEGVLAHPCFLYESIWCLTGALLLHLYSKKRVFSGQIILGYCVWYGLGRMFIEQLRTDSLFLGGPLRISTLLSVVLFIGGIVTTVIVLRRKRAPKEEEYIPQFADAIDSESAESIEE
ncbi:MAG: prolipoprotein diacylglyceryl transferase [Clostridia bacterium]|nr:prolipoprotein diacylglyceryl transferase [Clostridia bacterium]